MHTILCKRKSPKGKLHLTYIFVFAALVISTVYQQPELGFDCLSQICFLGNRWIKWTQADGGRSFSFSFFIIVPRSDVNTCDGFTLFLSVLKGTHCRHDFIWSLLKTKEANLKWCWYYSWTCIECAGFLLLYVWGSQANTSTHKHIVQSVYHCIWAYLYILRRSVCVSVCVCGRTGRRVRCGHGKQSGPGCSSEASVHVTGALLSPVYMWPVALVKGCCGVKHTNYLSADRWTGLCEENIGFYFSDHMLLSSS